MEDLTKLNVTNLKKQIFELCQYIMPNDLLTEAGMEIHIFHDIRIIKTGESYSMVDYAKDKPSELNNKYLLYKIKEDLEGIVLAVQTEVIEESELEAFAEAKVFEAEPSPEAWIALEAAEKELRIAKIFEEEEEVNPIEEHRMLH